MKEIKYVPDPLNEQASILVDAQTDIKTAVKQGVLAGNTAEAIKKKLAAIIESAVARIRSPTLKLDARKSLMLFANKVYGDFSSTVRIIPSPMLPAVIVLMRAISEKQPNLFCWEVNYRSRCGSCNRCSDGNTPCCCSWYDYVKHK